jgi:hypothetical protein
VTLILDTWLIAAAINTAGSIMRIEKSPYRLRPGLLRNKSGTGLQYGVQPHRFRTLLFSKVFSVHFLNVDSIKEAPSGFLN